MNPELLRRSVPFTITRADDDDDGDGLTLEGYAAVFNTPTRIDSWEGRFDEVISPGAFAKTIKERSPKLQFDHGTHPLLGSLPLGRIDTLKEDDEGLFVRARLSDNWLIEPVRDAIRDGAVDGMSFQFKAIRDEWDEDDDLEVPLRTLKEVRLYELGPVVFPAYEETSVGVRSEKVAELRSLLQDETVRHHLAQALLLDAPTFTTPQVSDGADAVTPPETARDADLQVTSRQEIIRSIREIDLILTTTQGVDIP